jgi:hypothetical protein
VGKWLLTPALLVKPSLPISLSLTPCQPVLEEEEVLKLSAPHWPIVDGVRGCGLAEYFWEPASHLKNAPKQVGTSHWANLGKSQPHAIILGQLTHMAGDQKNKSKTSGPHLRQLPRTLSLDSCPHSSLSSQLVCVSGFRPSWNYLLFVALHSPLRLATLSFWRSKCSLRTSLPLSNALPALQSSRSLPT